MPEGQKNARQPLLARIEQVIDQIRFQLFASAQNETRNVSKKAGSSASARMTADRSNRAILQLLTAATVDVRSKRPSMQASPKNAPGSRIAMTASLPKSELTTISTAPLMT